jgi:alkaline phosphatase D
VSVVNMVVGATTPGGATFVAKVTTGPVRVAVADNASMTSPVFTSSQAVDAQKVAKVSITGLAPSTPYWWRVEDNGTIDTAVTGRFRTHPAVGTAASYTIGIGFCAGSNPDFPGVDGGELAQGRVSNHPVFDTIRTKALAEDWPAFVHLGDLHYYDPGSGVFVPDASLSTYRAGYDDVLTQPRQHQLYREVSWVSVWDDHDFGPNNSDGTFADKANAAQVYRERVPHYPLDDSGGIWQSFQIGRVLFVMSDTRYYRSPNDDADSPAKSMLGTAQKAWLSNLLDTTTAEALVWLMPSQWLGIGSDTWDQFQTERAELVGLLDTHGWLGRMVMVYGDRHAMGLTGGVTNAFGSFPVMNCGSLDSSFGTEDEGRFDVGPELGGRDHFGTVEVTDLGNLLLMTLTCWDGDDEYASYTFALSLAPATVTAPGALLRSLSGSHHPVFEARVLTTFQTGEDPQGTVVDILGGDVIFDATAEVFATLQLETRGGDGRDGLFPRHEDDLLAPYGNEVFVRRGVDIGNEILWVPLGYFRIDTAEQSGGAYDPIRISGQDRMAGIVDGRLIFPRQFEHTRTVGSVVNELVREIYPDAVVAFDAGGSGLLGRTLVVEEDRFEAVHDIADSLGKIAYWDGTGVLRIEDPPDLDEITWTVNAGRNGVQTNVARSLTRDGFYNAVVARGEGATETPVQGIAVDDGVNSPTRWDGRFGRVPRFYSSPLLTTGGQARTAARSLLSRYIGMPYSVNFGAIPNPALRPRDVIRIVHQDGNREKHVVDSCTIPLTAGVVMSGMTRKHTQAHIADLA